jgi:hypothetical protein
MDGQPYFDLYERKRELAQLRATEREGGIWRDPLQPTLIAVGNGDPISSGIFLMGSSLPIDSPLLKS